MGMKLTAVCFGEVLWDVFPTHKKIGGAPLNVALRLNSFGIETFMASKVGKDENGQIILNYISDNGVHVNLIQQDSQYKTGEVLVVLDASGSATYDINAPVAWDHIEFNKDLRNQIVASDVFIFGSLVCRNRVSKEALFKALSMSKFKVFDVNLRAPHYDHVTLLSLMKCADFIKFNDEEIVEICQYNDLNYNDLESQVKAISTLTDTDEICVTLGAQGALLYKNQSFYYNKGIPVKVADTVGAGDSFLASLTYQLLSGHQPQKALNFACVIGAIVASKEGANPVIQLDEINQKLL